MREGKIDLWSLQGAIKSISQSFKQAVVGLTHQKPSANSSKVPIMSGKNCVDTKITHNIINFLHYYNKSIMH